MLRVLEGIIEQQSLEGSSPQSTGSAGAPADLVSRPTNQGLDAGVPVEDRTTKRGATKKPKTKQVPEKMVVRPINLKKKKKKVAAVEESQVEEIPGTIARLPARLTSASVREQWPD